MNKEQKDDYYFEACLGYYSNFAYYMNSYHRAFDVLMKEVEISGNHVDILAYPMLFLARHTIELGLKANIRLFSEYSHLTDYTNSDSHNLKALFGGFKLHITKVITDFGKEHGEIEKEVIDDYSNQCLKVEELIDLFDSLDKGSFSFRYPVDTKNNKVFNSGDRTNLLKIQTLLDETMLLLRHTYDILKPYLDYSQEISSIYENMMKEYYGNYE